MSTQSDWPDLEDASLTPDQRELLRQMTIRRLVKLAKKVEQIEPFTDEERGILMRMIRERMAMRVAKEMAPWVMPIAGFLLMALYNLDRIVAAAKSVRSTWTG